MLVKSKGKTKGERLRDGIKKEPEENFYEKVMADMEEVQEVMGRTYNCEFDEEGLMDELNDVFTRRTKLKDRIRESVVDLGHQASLTSIKGTISAAGF